MNGSVFLVEDDLDVLEYYEFLLEAESFEVWAADTNGEAAIARYESASARPDVVILDHRLPGCTGVVVAEALLRLDPDVVIVFVTADDAAIESARDLGIQRLNRKPCNSDLLIRDLRSAVAERRDRLGA